MYPHLIELYKRSTVLPISSLQAFRNIDDSNKENLDDIITAFIGLFRHPSVAVGAVSGKLCTQTRKPPK